MSIEIVRHTIAVVESAVADDRREKIHNEESCRRGIAKFIDSCNPYTCEPSSEPCVAYEDAKLDFIRHFSLD